MLYYAYIKPNLTLDLMEIQKPPSTSVDHLSIQPSIEALKRSEYINRQLVQTLAAAIYTCDADGYITFYNKAAVELWGREPQIGKDLWCGSWKIYNPDDGSRMDLSDCPMARALKGGKPVRGEEIIVERPDGVRRNILPHPDPIFDTNGKVIAAVNMLVDITTLKQKENELRSSEEKLKRLANDLKIRVEERTRELNDANASLTSINKELEQFAFIASHDMQEPLRKIKTFTNRLDRNSADQLDQVSKSYLNKIKSSSERMEALIHDVLNYSRLGYFENQFVETDLNQTVQNLLNDFEVLIEEKRAVINSDKLPVIPAIPLQMNQLFHNLFSNALKFSKADEPCKLSIRSRALNPKEVSEKNLNTRFSYSEIIFQDNGIGFKQEFADSIFKIFKRLNSKDKYEGSGIGLALCKKIVSIHQGEIYAESGLNDGTTIRIILPVKKYSHVSR
jgi:PAS domain S-box-containing protein